MVLMMTLMMPYDVHDDDDDENESRREGRNPHRLSKLFSSPFASYSRITLVFSDWV